MAKLLTIRTKRLLITTFNERHLTERYVAWMNDRELMRYSEQRHTKHTLESCHNYWQSFQGTPNYFWAIEETKTDMAHIGNASVYVDTNNSLADLSILIGEKALQNKRYGFEAWLGLCDFLLKEVSLRKLVAGTMAVNLPMVKLMHRVGMIEDGVRRRHYICEGQEVDIIYMALFRDQWDEIVANDSLIREYLGLIR
jgi:RimJ/RimL family protein N-acetyltransferase